MTIYPSFRAPATDGGFLVEPSLASLGTSLHENRSQLDSPSSAVRWLNVPLNEIRQGVRRQLEQALAVSWHDRPLILTGHQPEWFHPGVWFKNFLLSSMAEKYSAIPLNILVDQDLARHFRFDVPRKDAKGKVTRAIVDSGFRGHETPFELTQLKSNSDLGDTFEQTCQAIESLGLSDITLRSLWPTFCMSLTDGQPLGLAMAKARQAVEVSHGVNNFELPLSHLTTTTGWRLFFGECIANIEGLHRAYNQSLKDYREFHRIKHAQQPIPSLGQNDGWWELPFWGYSASHPSRRRLWMASHSDFVQLSDLQGRVWSFPHPSASLDEWLKAWENLSNDSDSLSVRPRALMTTIFLRMAVGDWFIHGIGGAKYDQISDQIIRRLWSTEAPKYSVATATIHLPSWSQSQSSTSSKLLARQLRDWRFTPDRAVSGLKLKPMVVQAMEEKRSLLTNTPSFEHKPAWHQKIVSLNETIRSNFPDFERALQEQFDLAIHREIESSIQTHREFSLAIFPEHYLVDRLKQLCQEAC
jgi:hypothetical protein